MKTERIAAFSDGVIAIIITIMVLEMKVPHHKPNFSDLVPMIPVFLSYVLSFVFIGIYWNNHHHLLHALKNSTAGVLWANLHLLFWLSLIPFATGWMGENNFAPHPIALYGFVLLACAIAYTILAIKIIRLAGPDSPLAREIGNNFKGKISLVAYVAAIPLAFFLPWLAGMLFVAVAVLWLIPDRRIERALGKEGNPGHP
jgi:uncharacterized membrane protein